MLNQESNFRLLKKCLERRRVHVRFKDLHFQKCMRGRHFIGQALDMSWVCSR